MLSIGKVGETAKQAGRAPAYHLKRYVFSYLFSFLTLTAKIKQVKNFDRILLAGTWFDSTGVSPYGPDTGQIDLQWRWFARLVWPSKERFCDKEVNSKMFFSCMLITPLFDNNTITYTCCHGWFFHRSKFLSFSLLFLFHNLAVSCLDLAYEFPSLVPSSRIHTHTGQTTKPPRGRKVLSQPVLSAHFTTQNIASVWCTLGRVWFLGGTYIVWDRWTCQSYT